MGVARHLHIDLPEYDFRIRTFVPHYETMVRLIAEVISSHSSPSPTIIDLGIGTGALAQACLEVRPAARIVGIDTDPEMLTAARARLGVGRSVELVNASFLAHPLPPADAMVACISLHHIPRPNQKQEFYLKAFRALRPGGILVTGDCFPSTEPGIAAQERQAWIAHLERTYSRTESDGYLNAWAGEDTYYQLDREFAWMSEAGFRTEVVWREDGFAVLAGFREEA